MTGSPSDRYKYDVALSFLDDDRPLATELYTMLAGTLRVFLYTKAQRRLAGADGLDVFSSIFRKEAKLDVILLNKGWGEERWTRVEALAIREHYFDCAPAGVFVIKLDPEVATPSWIPTTHIWMGLSDFGIDETVGAIRLRAVEAGAIPRIETAIDKARRLAERTELEDERQERLRSNESVKAATSEFVAVQDEIARIVTAIRASETTLPIEIGRDEHYSALTTGLVGLTVRCRRSGNTLRESCIDIVEYSGRIHLPGRPGYLVASHEKLTDHVFQFDYMVSLGWCWRREADGKHFDSKQLADHAATLLIGLIDRAMKGEFQRRPKLGPGRVLTEYDVLDHDDGYSPW